jgi:glycosyltransferase involved in cell wall biosynthesis
VHIEFVLSMFLPQSGGGTEIYTHHIAHALQAMGQDVTVFTADLQQSAPEGAPALQETYYDTLPVTQLRFSSWTRADTYGSHIVLNRDVYQMLLARWRQQRPDIVHVTYCGELTVAPLQAALDLKLPVVMTVTDFWLICPLGTAVRRDGQLCRGRQTGRTCQHCILGETRVSRTLDRLPSFVQRSLLALTEQANGLFPHNSTLNLIQAVDRRNRCFPPLLQQVDQLLTPSEFMRRMLIESQVAPAEKIMTFRHGHEVERASAGQRKAPSAQLRFGYTGHILPIKGVDVLVRAFRRLPSDAATLTIYGDPMVAPHYSQACQELAANDPRIRFAGRFDNREIGRVLQEIDILVVPSVCYENAPITIAEAFAAHTPVIATDLGGMAEAVTHEVDGLRFPLGDDQALAMQMQRLLAEPDLLNRLYMGIRPVRTVQEESQALLHLYRSLLDSRVTEV